MADRLFIGFHYEDLVKEQKVRKKSFVYRKKAGARKRVTVFTQATVTSFGHHDFDGAGFEIEERIKRLAGRAGLQSFCDPEASSVNGNSGDYLGVELTERGGDYTEGLGDIEKIIRAYSECLKALEKLGLLNKKPEFFIQETNY